MGSPQPFVADRVRQAATVAAMKSAPKQSGDQFATQEFATGANGGGRYKYHASGRPAQTNGGTVIEGSGADDYFELLNPTTIDVAKFGADEPGISDTTCTSRIQEAIDATLDGGTVYSTRLLRFTPGQSYQIGALTIDTASRLTVEATGAAFFLNSTSPGFTVSSSQYTWNGGTFFNSDGTTLVWAIDVKNTATASNVTGTLNGVRGRDLYRFVRLFMTQATGTCYRHRLFACDTRTTPTAMQVSGGYGVRLDGDTPNDSAGNDTELHGCKLVGHTTNLYTNGSMTQMIGGAVDGGAESGVELDGAALFRAFGVYFEYNTHHYKYTNSPSTAISFGSNYTASSPTVGFSTGTMASGHSHLSYGETRSLSMGIGTQDPQEMLHLSHLSGDGTLLFENRATGISGQVYGAIEYEGNDTSTNANGVRARHEFVATGTQGEGDYVWYTAPANSQTLSERLRLKHNGDFVLTGLVLRSSQSGITASTVQAAGNRILSAEVNEVATVANAGDSITLPSAAGGLQCTVINNGANTIGLWPNTGDDLGAGVNTSTSLAAGATVRYVAFDDTHWAEV